MKAVAWDCTGCRGQRTIRIVGAHNLLAAQEFPPKIKGTAIGMRLSSIDLHIQLGLFHIQPGQAGKIPGAISKLRWVIEKPLNQVDQMGYPTDGERIPMPQFQEILQAHIVEMS